MVEEKLAFASAYEVRELVSSGQVSPVELTQLFFDRIERLDSQLNAYLTLNYDEAMQRAREAEAAVARGDELGPLHGVPISIKDLELTKGIRTTSGSLHFKDRVPDEDSVVVERVRKAGAIILGKTNTPEFGHKGTTENLLGDACRNPWNTERTPGGSSGGAAAALAAGLCSLATGSDGGGSIRIPASFCGLYGIKPTQGRVPRYGGVAAPILANQTSQSGPLSRTVRDSALLLQVLAGYDSRDPGSIRDAPPDFLAALRKGVSGLKVGWSSDYGFAPVDPEVVDVCYRAAKVFEELGCSVEETDLVLDAPTEPFKIIFSVNTYAAMGPAVDEFEHEFTDYFMDNMRFAKTVTASDYVRAVGYIDRLKAQFADQFQRYDLILSPTMAVPPFPVGDNPTHIAGREVDPFTGFLPFTFPINMNGHTAASIPAGFSSDGLPIGLHIVGRWGDEETVFAASAAFEEARPWADKRPAVS
ncbi:MAG: amidase [Chloroflexi bacterium]|nr:amidase [Chloroflexota bacterium]